MQRWINTILGNHLYTKVYINNINIFSNILKEYIAYLNTIFKLFETKNIVISPSKLYIGFPSI